MHPIFVGRTAAPLIEEVGPTIAFGPTSCGEQKFAHDFNQRRLSLSIEVEWDAPESKLPRPGGGSSRAGELRMNGGRRGTLPIAARAGNAPLRPFLIDGSWIRFAQHSANWTADQRLFR